jgi:hypothetical protein
MLRICSNRTMGEHFRTIVQVSVAQPQVLYKESISETGCSRKLTIRNGAPFKASSGP